MFRSYRVGQLFGFPIDVNLSFLIMLGAVLLFMGGFAGVLVVLLAFASVLLHELGHALVARHLQVRVSGIELYFFGGAAKMVEQPKNAGDEIAIAAAGPAVSFVLGGIGLTLAALTGWSLFHLLGWVNLIIGSFNLVPALPMDGGRILRAFLARRSGFGRATELAVKISRGFAIAFAVIGLATLQLYLLLLAGVLWIMGSAELQNSRIMGYREEPQVMPRGFGTGHHPDGDWSEGGNRHPHSGVQWPSKRGGFVIRRRGNRFVIEPLEH